MGEPGRGRLRRHGLDRSARRPTVAHRPPLLDDHLPSSFANGIGPRKTQSAATTSLLTIPSVSGCGGIVRTVPRYSRSALSSRFLALVSVAGELRDTSVA